MSSIYLYIIYISRYISRPWFKGSGVVLHGGRSEMAGDGRRRIHTGNIRSLAPFLLLCYSTHKSSILRGREREYSDGTAKESSGGWKGVRELVGSASLSRRAEASRPSGIARYSMESEDSPRFLRRGRSEIGWNTDPSSLYRDGGFIFFKGSLITMASVFPYRLAAILIGEP